MRANLLWRSVVFFGSVALCLMGADPAKAQRSTWGNPVITLGLTPYHAVSTGHGNYPGSDGFIPGYGYYPGPFPSRYPWSSGPSRPVEVIEVQPDRTALLTVRGPADAEIWFSDQKTSQQGAVRQFVTPPLESGHAFSYDIRARWRSQGTTIDQTRTVRVRPGDRLTVDFLKINHP